MRARALNTMGFSRSRERTREIKLANRRGLLLEESRKDESAQATARGREDEEARVVRVRDDRHDVLAELDDVR